MVMKSLLLSSILLLVVGCTHTVDRFKCSCDCNSTTFSCSENDTQLNIEGP